MYVSSIQQEVTMQPLLKYPLLLINHWTTNSTHRSLSSFTSLKEPHINFYSWGKISWLPGRLLLMFKSKLDDCRLKAVLPTPFCTFFKHMHIFTTIYVLILLCLIKFTHPNGHIYNMMWVYTTISHRYIFLTGYTESTP